MNLSLFGIVIAGLIAAGLIVRQSALMPGTRRLGTALFALGIALLVLGALGFLLPVL